MDGTHIKHVPTYECSRIFFSDHYGPDPEFARLIVSFPHLETWISRQVDDSFSIQLDDGAELRLSYRDQRRLNAKGEMVSDGMYQIVITPDEPIGYDTYFKDYINPLQHFFCFVMGQTVFPDDILGVKEGFQASRTSRNLRSKGISGSSTSIRYSISNRHLMRDKSPICYFYLSDVKGEIERILNDWFQFVENHTPTVELFFDSTYYSKQPYPSITLLNLARALEAYHRGSDSYTNRYIDEHEFEGYYKELKATIQNDFPRSFRDHLKDGTFKFANRKSLRRRLNELFRDQQDHLEKIHNDSVAVGQIVDDVVGLRNDLTHLSDESIRKFDNKSREGHNSRLRILVELLIFDEVGMPRDGFFSRFK